jgi:excisionase family DNA binding protein
MSPLLANSSSTRKESMNGTDTQRLDQPTDAHSKPLLDVRAVARLLGCSSRHVRRLADSGRMPRPLHLGALRRWRLDDLQQWIGARCPAVPSNMA